MNSSIPTPHQTSRPAIPAAGRQGGAATCAENDIFDAIYAGATQPATWPAMLEALRQYLGAIDVTMIMKPVASDSCGDMFSTCAMGPTGREAYRSHFFAVDPFTDLPQDHVVLPEEVVGESAWRNSELFRDFMQPSNVTQLIGADLIADDGLRCRFRVSRATDAPAFSCDDRARCTQLLPHIQRATRVYRRFSRLTQQRQLYADAADRLGYGTVQVTLDGSVVSASSEAQRILAQKDGLSLHTGRLHVQHAAESRELQRCIRSAISSGTTHGEEGSCSDAVLVSRPSGRMSYGVVVRGASPPAASHRPTMSHLRPTAVLLLRDPELGIRATPGAESAVRQLFGLSHKESELALALADGLSIEEAAERCNISRNTARTYMRAVFLKTGVNRQTSLVRLLLNNVVALADKPTPLPLPAVPKRCQ